MKIFTAHKSYAGPHRAGIDGISGHPLFAPQFIRTPDMDEAEFMHRYFLDLRASYEENQKEWHSFLSQKEIVFTSSDLPLKFSQRILLVFVLEKFFACEYIGEINTRNKYRIIPHREVRLNLLTSAVDDAVTRFDLGVHYQGLVSISPARPAIEVDPFAISEAQGNTCRQCRENRQVNVWTPKGTVGYEFGTDASLSSKTQNCCDVTWKEGERSYNCPIFKDLVEGYHLGLRVQGTNFDPCKNCDSHIDRNGSCTGEQCPDGPFPIKPLTGREVGKQ